MLNDTCYYYQVDKLLKENFIMEANYLDWIANFVLVKKANGNWRVCVDFTDLNRVFLKDRFPLLRIDQLVDALQASFWCLR